ncbi:MarR family winged helix-turn-helix transcriptional regulator [Geobacter grbiciae]|uniref:MarR family winged helix-turn-helix transcriptional regulator n=1 Tax=Geobacter grbiciae TaxID=155042 RepID=UPI001C00CDB6|nr:MarR family transcriptional regulator [Geobacter grbiciae]MBT1073985.1 MarR family transcriptional regulator [Geobacter grbiciae]
MKPTADLIAQVTDNLRRVFQVVNEHSKRAMRETGLTGPQLWAIKVIAGQGPLRVSDLARRLYLHNATVVGIIDRLEAQGLAQRTRSREDRRVVMVDLTEQGKDLVARSPVVAQGLLVAGLEKIPREKLETISEGFDLMVRILGAKNLPPQLILSPEVNRGRAKVGRKRRATGE